MKDPIPNKPHYAVVMFDSRQVWHEGDERSRTNPGHGYPAGYETVEEIKYQAFDTKEELEDFLLNDRYFKRYNNYRILEVIPLKSEVKVSLSVLS